MLFVHEDVYESSSIVYRDIKDFSYEYVYVYVELFEIEIDESGINQPSSPCQDS